MALPDWLTAVLSATGTSGGGAAALILLKFRKAIGQGKIAARLAHDANATAQSTAADFERLKVSVNDQIERWKRGSMVDSPTSDGERIHELAERIAILETRATESERRVSSCEDDLDTHSKDDASAFLEIERSLSHVKGMLDGNKRR